MKKYSFYPFLRIFREVNEVSKEKLTEEDMQETNLELEETSEEVLQNNEAVQEEKEELSLEDQIEQLNKQVKDLETQLEEKDNRYLRLQADLDNYRRRARLDAEASEKYRAQSLITDLLPIIDNFERALQVRTNSEEVKSVLTGMEMVYKSLLDALKNEGAEQIEAIGKEFDPHFHQAVMQVQDEAYDSNIVIEELQKGYILKDRVIRPSMVKVNE